MDKSNDPPDLSIYQSLLSSFSAEVHTAKASYFHNKINSTFDTRNLFKTFNSLLCPPPPTSLTADDFATFFTNKTRSISSQFHTCRNSNQPHLLLKLPSSHSVPSLRQKYPNFSSPATLQHTLLIQSPHTFSMQSLLHSYQHSHTSSTHLSLQAPSPLHSSRLGLPHCSKNLH